MTRRRDVLQGLATVSALSVAGCTGSGDDEGSDTGSDSSDQEADQGAQQGQEESQAQQGKQSPSAQRGDDIPPAEVVIDYWSDWTGNIGTSSTSKSVQGYGKDAWSLSPMPSVVSVTAQKQDDTLDPLTVEIYVNGELRGEQSTTAEYGVASLSIRP